MSRPEQCGVLRWIAGRLKVAAASPGVPRSGQARPGRQALAATPALLNSGYTFRYPTYREGYEALIAQPEGEGEVVGAGG